MINTLLNSSQPYLYNINNDLMLLYCFAAEPITRYFRQNSYQIKPWKIYNYNLTNDSNISIDTPTTITDKGQVIVECNPHVYIHNNYVELVYTAGTVVDVQSPVVYYICSIKSNDLNFNNLYDFKILASSIFNGTYHNNNLLLIDKSNITADTLVEKSQDTENIINTYSHFDLTEILRIINVFDNDKYIITGKYNTNYKSYLLNHDLSINSTLKNSNNEDIYKCTIHSNLLAYTVMGEGGYENRSIILEPLL